MSVHARFVQWCNENEIDVPENAMSGLNLIFDARISHNFI